MMWLNEVSSWLIDSAVFGAVILALGSIAVYSCREPIYRIRIIQWTFTGCLLVPLLHQLDQVPSYHMALWSLPQENDQEAVQQPNDAVPATEPQTGRREVHYDNERFESVYVKTSDDSSASLAHIATDEGARPNNEVASTTTSSSYNNAESTVQEATLGPSPLGTPFVSAATVLRVVQVAYATVICSLLIFWCVSLYRRHLLAHDADVADDSARRSLIAVAGSRAERVRLLVSDQVTAPIMWGVFRPTIVIPRELASTPNSDQLRWGLAHEWSHVLRGDFVRWLVAGVAKFACFYQPAYWWMRRQLLLSQDYLADAFAANHGESAEDYAAFLVSLARARNRPQFAPALGIGDRRSQLLRRVKMLVQSTRPVLQRDGRVSAVLITSAAILLLGGLSTLRLNAAPNDPTVAVATTQPVNKNQAQPIDDPVEKPTKAKEAGEKQAEEEPADTKPATEELVADKPEEKPAQKDKPKKHLPEAITYKGKIVELGSGKPIAGAQIEITRELSRHPKTGQWSPLRTTTHESDAEGNYSFTLPPEEVAEPSLYIVVDAHHRDYQSKGRSGYSHTMILKNMANGEPPFYSTIKLAAGEPLTGLVLTPDGKPAANTQILTYSKPPALEPGRSFLRGAFQYGETDDEGRFRVVVATPGDGVLWVFPKNHCPIAHRIGDKRGDIGPFELVDGARLSGQVLDAKGNPVPNVAVNLRRRGDGEEADEFLNSNAVSNAIGTGAKTDAEGKFTLKPLPPGDYRAQVSDGVRDQSVRPNRSYARLAVDHVFSAMSVTISPDEPADSILFRASPHVIVRGRFFDGKGKPRESHVQNLFGTINGESYFARSTTPGKDGWFEFKVPHGTERVHVRLSTNEHSALRWRTSLDQPYTYGHDVDIGTVEADHSTLEVIRYVAPLLLLKVVDEEGKPVTDFVPRSKYKTRPLSERTGQFISGAQGDIGFEKQPDGRWRSSQMLPDDEVTITIEKDGFTSEPQVVTMKEGEEKEIVFQLKKKKE